MIPHPPPPPPAAGHRPSFLLPHPIPNPNPNFFLPHHHHLPNPQLPPPPPEEQPPTLSSTLSSLTQLLSQSHQTLTSLTSQIALRFPPNPDNAPCFYNPNHLIPAESLFLHYLHCHASPLPASPSSVLRSLHYPKTLNPNHRLPEGTLQGTSADEVRLSLSGYYKEFGSNFLYNDCPAVVCLNELDFPDRVFTLPQVLLSECGGFAENSDDLGGDDGFGILPSDAWFVGMEVDGWVDFPRTYSYCVLCAALRLDLVAWSDLGRWLISSSPRYGVVIDAYMRDHLALLFRLCLKAIKREAVRKTSDTRRLRFECQCLVQVLMWLSTQLSVLYGQENAKSFVVHVFKQCLLEAAKRAVIVFLKIKKEEDIDALGVGGSPVGDVKPDEGLEGSMKNEDKVGRAENGAMLSQVVAAVAALHERFLLEQKIKMFQSSTLPPAYQRNAEHDNVSKRADEERSKRSAFRMIIEHDGLLRRHLSNQETSNKTKTREELLAEERDYKRRRMSYRGKKSKRTKLEVTRDLIEEYMEEIKEAGGIGCFEGGTDVTGTTASYSTLDRGSPRKDKDSFDHDSRHFPSRETSVRKYDQRKQNRLGNNEEPEYRRSSHDRHHGEFYSEDSGRKENDHRYKQSIRERELDDFKIYRSRHPEKRSSNKSSHSRHKSTEPVLRSDDDLSEWNNDCGVPARGRTLSNLVKKHDSKYLDQDTFDDRYDPTYSRT